MCPQPLEDGLKVVAVSVKDRIDAPAETLLDTVPRHLSHGFHLTGTELVDRSTSLISLGLAIDTALLGERVNTPRLGRVVTAITLVDIDPLEIDADVNHQSLPALPC